MSLSDLPTELVYRLFSHLHAEDILLSFRLVCRRFYAIVDSYDELRVELNYQTSLRNTEHLCRVLQPSRVVSLHWHQSRFNPEVTRCFVLSGNLDRFHRLRSLTLWNISEEHLTTIVLSLAKSSFLSSISIGTTRNEIWNHRRISYSLLPLIALRSLRQLTLDLHQRNIPSLSWRHPLWIEELTLRRCSYHQFCQIFDRSPNLRRFVLNDSEMDDIDRSIRPTTGRSLTSLTLKLIDMSMSDLEFFLSLHPRLLSLTLTTKSSVSWQIFQRFTEWETFLRSTLPDLQKLHFSLSNGSAHFQNVESILRPLCTAFWLEEKQWYFTCQYTESFTFKQIQLSSVTSSSPAFPDCLNHGNLSYAITTRRANDDTKMWSARVDLTWLIDTLIKEKFTVADRHYFRHLARLAFDIDTDPLWPIEGLQRLSTWIDLAQLRELWILEMSPHELEFGAIRYLLEQAWQLRTFGLTYNDLPSRIADLGAIVSGRIDHFKVRGVDLQGVKATLQHIRRVSTITFEQLTNGSSVFQSIIEYLTQQRTHFIVDYNAASIQIQNDLLEMNRGLKRKRTMITSERKLKAVL